MADQGGHRVGFHGVVQFDLRREALPQLGYPGGEQPAVVGVEGFGQPGRRGGRGGGRPPGVPPLAVLKSVHGAWTGTRRSLVMGGDPFAGQGLAVYLAIGVAGERSGAELLIPAGTMYAGMRWRHSASRVAESAVPSGGGVAMTWMACPKLGWSTRRRRTRPPVSWRRGFLPLRWGSPDSPRFSSSRRGGR